ncbi:hypothetical protein [Flavilitoribacter nigricans]|uniref:T9SS type A sorting domain-containing protein n=1 Tax=Flavilitoribacter nigricans (strain ATCC 23147 / DSM 23189 / NBRC 102662 / NCIMB 1420 / SS-2) TaxID=1122177 RepID=A0A2D0NBD0_FLAN2|nr:hypothetical protein [Flavilitoribacter nigricans]PHN05795.1 hypothetical protein CRP01_15085 [Flavilitoribacter nigricans DSM 23189 = NBRC 102662]
MRKKALAALIVLLGLTGPACNKEIESVPVPPFTVFPNPFLEDFAVHLENSFPAGTATEFRILDGKDQPIMVWEDPAPGTSIRVDMTGRAKALYYAELRVGNSVFIQPIVKAQ